MSFILNIRTIDWHDALPIRHKVLWPNKPESFCKIEGDESALHFGVYIKGLLVCVASIYINDSSARLRKFATLVEYQGQGIGSKLIAHILNQLKLSDIALFWCDARTTAVGFYQKLGMEQQGKEFEKSGVLYFKMAVQLNYSLSIKDC